MDALYLINGEALPLPDAGVEMSFEDLDGSDAGRDEAGFMHRSLLRRKLGVWNFVYSYLTQQEFTRLQSILPEGGTFSFTYPDPADPTASKTVTAYLSKYGISWYNATTGQYRNLKFSIIQC